MTFVQFLARQKRFVLGINVLAFVVYCAHSPLALYANAGHDDRWHIEQARHLIHGDWMGPFGVLTLIKGPGYGFFLVLNAWLGFPLPIAHGLFHVLCVNLFAFVTWRISRSSFLQLSLAALLTWHPVFMNPRALRDAIYSGQTLAVIALWAWLLTDRSQGWRRGALAGVTGVGTAWFWLTREESVWILPALISLALICGLARGQQSWGHYTRWPAAAFLVCIACTQTIAAVNYIKYRGWVTIDVKEKNYVEALSLLNNLSSSAPEHYVPVPLDVREKLYRESPAFASLQPTFESSVEGWAHGPLKRPPYRDYESSIFMWVFRDAVANGGHYKSEASASAFYAQLAREIKSACREGKLTCYQPWLDYVPHVSSEAAKVVIPSLVAALKESLWLERIQVTRELSMGPVDDVLEFLNFPRIWPAADVPNLPWGAGNILRIKGALKAAYPWVTLLLLSGSGFALLVTMVWRKTQLHAALVQLSAITLCCWVALMTRCSLLALMVATHMNVLDNSQYIAPCYYLLPCAALLTTTLGILTWRAENARAEGSKSAAAESRVDHERLRAS